MCRGPGSPADCASFQRHWRTWFPAGPPLGPPRPRLQRERHGETKRRSLPPLETDGAAAKKAPRQRLRLSPPLPHWRERRQQHPRANGDSPLLGLGARPRAFETDCPSRCVSPAELRPALPAGTRCGAARDTHPTGAWAIGAVGRRRKLAKPRPAAIRYDAGVLCELLAVCYHILAVIRYSPAMG